MSSPFDVSYKGSHLFDGSPPEIWTELAKVDRFESWWPWMRNVTLTGDALQPGSVFSFSVDPPVRYKMQIEVEVTDASPQRWLEGLVSGDLSGRAHLELAPDGDRTLATVAWEVEIANPHIRRVIRVARPVLLWAQRWAVEIALLGFRSHLRNKPKPPSS